MPRTATTRPSPSGPSSTASWPRTASAATELLSFGDGVVETEEVRRVGGTAVAVASDLETGHDVNRWKRDRLVPAGADVVIPDYRRHDAVLAWLFDDVQRVPRCRYPQFDRSRLRIQPLGQRQHDLTLADPAAARRRRPTSITRPCPSWPSAWSPRSKAGAARDAGDGRPRPAGRRPAAPDRPDGARPDRPRRHERGRADPRLGVRPDRRHHRERGPLRPHRRVRPVAGDRPA